MNLKYYYMMVYISFKLKIIYIKFINYPSIAHSFVYVNCEGSKYLGHGQTLAYINFTLLL